MRVDIFFKWKRVEEIGRDLEIMEESGKERKVFKSGKLRKWDGDREKMRQNGKQRETNTKYKFIKICHNWKNSLGVTFT